MAARAGSVGGTGKGVQEINMFWIFRGHITSHNVCYVLLEGRQYRSISLPVSGTFTCSSFL